MRPLDSFKKDRNAFFDNIIIVIVLSFGISFIVNVLAFFFKDSPYVFIVCGLFCILFVLLIKIYNFYKLRKHLIRTEALFVVDNKAKPGKVYRYFFNEEFVRTLISTCKENKAFYECWKKAFKEEISTESKDKYVSHDFVFIKRITDEKVYKYCKDERICKFINELTEYIFIEWLSRKLDSYFEDNAKNIAVLHRSDIADYLLENRFLDLMSKPIEDREKFLNKINDKDCFGDIYTLVGDDNVEFNKFELILPPKTKLYKDDKGFLIISGKYFKIKMQSSFIGVNADIPDDFHRFYVSTPNMTFYSIPLKLEVSLKPFFFLLSSNWKNLLWIDSVCESFLHDFSYRTFIDDIGFDQSITSLMLYDKYLKATVKNMKDTKKNI